jgi:hypothetical protein
MYTWEDIVCSQERVRILGENLEEVLLSLSEKREIFRGISEGDPKRASFEDLLDEMFILQEDLIDQISEEKIFLRGMIREYSSGSSLFRY